MIDPIQEARDSCEELKGSIGRKKTPDEIKAMCRARGLDIDEIIREEDKHRLYLNKIPRIPLRIPGITLQ